MFSNTCYIIVSVRKMLRMSDVPHITCATLGATQLFPLLPPLLGSNSSFSNPDSDHLNDCQSLPAAHTPVSAAGQLQHSLNCSLEIRCKHNNIIMPLDLFFSHYKLGCVGLFQLKMYIQFL